MFYRIMDRNHCSFSTVPWGSISFSTGISAVVCTLYPFQGWWHGPSSLGSSGITRNGDSGLWLKIFTSVMCPGLAASFSQVMNELLVSVFGEQAFLFFLPTHLYSHFLWVKLLPEVELGILRLGLWIKKFWLVKKNFPLSKLLKKMVIWGCDPVEAEGVQSNGW